MSISTRYIDDIHRYLRINHNHFKGEIADLIGAAKADLLLGGISPAKVHDENDSLIKRAVVTYVKAEFGFDNPDAERLKESYYNLKTHLMLSSEYLGEMG